MESNAIASLLARIAWRGWNEIHAPSAYANHYKTHQRIFASASGNQAQVLLPQAFAAMHGANSRFAEN
jgi:hypothetical protein